MIGKEKCRALKRIRAEIARANEIELITEDCPHKGDCPGTCPHCEAEVQYLSAALERRRQSGLPVALAGIAADLVTEGGAPERPSLKPEPGDGLAGIPPPVRPPLELAGKPPRRPSGAPGFISGIARSPQPHRPRIWFRITRQSGTINTSRALERRLSVGSDGACGLVIDDPSVAPVHAIVTAGRIPPALGPWRLSIESASPGGACPVAVNGSPIAGRTPIGAEDVVTIGGADLVISVRR